jgi:hypothetical protein
MSGRFTLEMKTAVFAETLESLQHSTQHIPESRTFILMMIMSMV